MYFSFSIFLLISLKLSWTVTFLTNIDLLDMLKFMKKIHLYSRQNGSHWGKLKEWGNAKEANLKTLINYYKVIFC